MEFETGQLMRDDLLCLNEGKWLSDAIIEFYLNHVLLNEIDLQRLVAAFFETVKVELSFLILEWVNGLQLIN